MTGTALPICAPLGTCNSTHDNESIPANWRNIFAEVREAAGLWNNWPQNALRHSFISYHVARFRNENETAQIAGTSPTMIYKNYREIVRPKEAGEFFGLLPDSAALAEAALVTAGRAEAIHVARVAAGKRTGELNRKTGAKRITSKGRRDQGTESNVRQSPFVGPFPHCPGVG